MHYLKRNSLLSVVFVSIFLFASLISSVALAGNGSGGGQNPPLLQSTCMTSISENASNAGEQLGDNMTLVNNPPTIRLQFATNVADNTVWANNKNYIALYDGKHSIVPVDISRIDPNVNFAERDYIFVTPAAALAPGSYTIIIDAGLTSKNGASAGQEQSISFGVTEDNGNKNDTGGNSDTGDNNSGGNNDTGDDSNVVLTDISGHWAEDYIGKLATAGIISGYPNGTFKPDQTISRAEFVTIVVRALKLEPKTGEVFQDTSSHWAKDSIATAVGYNIVSGYNSASFGPDDNITREQMAVILDKALKLGNSEGGKTFTDKAEISVWAKDGVTRANQAGILSGYPDNTFRPKANATRAEAATVIIKAQNTLNQP